MAKFQVKKTNTGYNFLLIANNGQPIGASQVYKALKSALTGVESVKSVAPVAEVEDQTKEEVEEKKNPKFVLYVDKAGEFRFRLQAANGQAILASEGYTTLAACKNGVASVAKNAPEADIELPEEKEEEAAPAPKKEEKAEKPAEKPVKEEKAEEKKEAKPEPKPAPEKKEAKPAEKPVEKPAPEKKEAAKPAAPKAKGGNKKANVTNRLKERYESEVRKALQEKYQYSSSMQIPGLNKIVINIGVGDATQDAKKLEEAVAELTQIAGQKPIITKARKSIASFKLREGQSIGCKVTLRGVRMWDFFDKLVSIALPRVRDFRGVSKNAFDGRGNYTLGVREQLIFPEIDYDKVAKVRGMDIVIVTTAQTDKEAYTLLELLGMPFMR